MVVIITCKLFGFVLDIERHEATNILLFANNQLNQVGEEFNDLLSVVGCVVWPGDEWVRCSERSLIRGLDLTDLFTRLEGFSRS